MKTEDWVKTKKRVTDQVMGCSAFDDIAPITVFLYADLAYDKQARKALKSLKEHCSNVPEVMEIDEKQLTSKAGVGTDTLDKVWWDEVYNAKFEEILGAYPVERTYIDRWGAKAYVDAKGNHHSGDDAGFYPFYTDEETLRKDLHDYNYNED